MRVKSETKDYYTIECYDPSVLDKYTELKLYRTRNKCSDCMFNIDYRNEQNLLHTQGNVDDIDYYNFLSDTKNDGERLYGNMLFFSGENNFNIVVDSNTIIENWRPKNSSILGPIPTDIDVAEDSSANEVIYYIDKSMTNEYTVISENCSEYSKAEITLDNHMFLVITKNSGKTTFNDSTGAINVEMDDKSDYTVRVTDNDNICNWDWFTLTIDANDSKTLDVQFTDNGVLISGDNLKGTEVTVNNISDDSTLTIDESLTSVMIQNNGKEITATEVKQNINNTQNSNTSTNTNITANNNGSTNSSTESVSNVTTGDATKVSLIAFIFTVSAVTMTISIKRKKRN